MSQNKTISFLTIGDELLIGQVVNTNVSWLGQQATGCGYSILQSLTIGDDFSVIKESVMNLLSNSDVVICTGGLGPTHDDITKDVMKDIFGGEWIHHEGQLTIINQLFELRGKKPTQINIDQSKVPSSAQVIVNEKGTAPGLKFGKNGNIIYCIPGVPSEMKHLMETYIIDELKVINQGFIVLQKTLRTTGIAESLLAEMIGPPDLFLIPNSTLAFLPNPTGVRLRLLVKGKDSTQLHEQFEAMVNILMEKCGRFFVGMNDEFIEHVIIQKLTENQETISLAESCTGGLIGHKLTEIPGASAVFLSGIIAYSNDTKVEELGVLRSDLVSDGAVSEKVAISMAKGIRQKTGSTYGISTTGIAGPTGATSTKPVGLVYIGFSSPTGDFAERHVFLGNRSEIKERASTFALDLLRKKLLK